MKVTIIDAATDTRHPATVADNAEHVTIAACPRCEARPGLVRGTGHTHHDHDTYYAPATALCCRAQIGTVETKVSTIFGINEDERVLHGRVRVY